jgi:uncharacterized membrane protein
LLLVATIDLDLLRAAWLELSLGIYVLLTVLAMTVYAPSFRRQRDVAEAIAADAGDEADYDAASAKATRWGAIVALLTLAILVLMVWKPALWS